MTNAILYQRRRLGGGGGATVLYQWWKMVQYQSLESSVAVSSTDPPYNSILEFSQPGGAATSQGEVGQLRLKLINLVERLDRDQIWSGVKRSGVVLSKSVFFQN